MKRIFEKENSPMIISLKSDFEKFTKDSSEHNSDGENNSSTTGDFYQKTSGTAKKLPSLQECKKKYVGTGIATDSKKVNGTRPGLTNIAGKLFIKVVKVSDDSPARVAGIVAGEFVEESIYALANKPIGSTIITQVYSKKTNKIRKVSLTSKELCYK